MQRKHWKTKAYFNDRYVLLLLLTAGGYILAVTKIAPYQVDRYFMCVFPLLLIYAVYGVCCGVLTLTRGSSICAAGTAMVLIAFALFCISSSEVSYIYPNGSERTEKLKQYEDIPVVVLNGDYYDDSVLQWSFEFQNFDYIFLCRNNETSDIAIAAKDGKLDDGFLLYVHQDATDTDELFSKISEYLAIKSYVQITDVQKCRVFYCCIE